MEINKAQVEDRVALLKVLIFEFMGTCMMIYAFNLTNLSTGFMGRPFAYLIAYLIAV